MTPIGEPQAEGFPQPAPRGDLSIIRIAPAKSLAAVDLAELWRYRELFALLAWRDILIRYKQTGLGVAWALMQPLLTTAVLTFVFSRMAGLGAEGAPYHLIVLAGMLQWQLFSTAMANASNSVLSAGSMIGKVYFPRLVVPASAVVSSLLDFSLGYAVLLLLAVANGVSPSLRWLLGIPVALWVAGAALGLGLWFAGLSARYRDVRHLVPFVTSLGLFLSPVGFLTRAVPPEYRALYALNPLVGPIESFRWVVLGPQFAPAGDWVVTSGILTALVLAGGAYFFRALESRFADVI